MNPNDIAQQAIAYTQAGLSLIPIARGTKKTPKGFKWKEYQTRKPTPEEIEQWLRDYPSCGFGVVAGKVSSGKNHPDCGLEILDLEGRANLDHFRQEVDRRAPGLLDRLPRVSTPSGGRHIYYRCKCAHIQGNQKLAQRAEAVPQEIVDSLPLANDSFEKAAKDRGYRFIKDAWYEIKVLIETRGEGGQVLSPLCPPGVHPSGGIYKILKGSLLNIPEITPEERNVLLDSARACNEYVDENRACGVREASKHAVAGMSATGLRPGDDFNNRAGAFERAAALLEANGWRVFGKTPAGVQYSRPGVTNHSSATLFDNGLLYVFSTNAHPLEGDKAYTPYALLTELEHNGDYSAAAKALAAQGYGDQQPASAPDKIRNSYSEYENYKIREYPAPPHDAAFRGVAGELVRAIEPHTEADPVALLFQFLTAFGNAIGRKVYFRAEADRHYMNLFCVGVGASSKGRKGTGLGRIKAQLGEIDQSWSSNCVVKGMASGEGLVWAVRDEITKREPIKDKGRIVEYQDVITDEGVKDKRLLSIESEFASILKVAVREGNTLTALLRQAWDEGDLRTLTKNNAAKASGAHISIIGHITKDELLRYMDDTEVANGFANRILWYCCKRSKVLPEGGNLDSVSFIRIQESIQRAYRFGETERELRRDEAAKALWAKVYPKLSEGYPGLLGAVTARAEAQVMRLACLYAILDCSTQIKVTHLQSGLALWDYCERSAKYIFGDSLGDPTSDVILAAVREAADIGLTKTQISDLFKRNASASQINRALNVLIESGKIRSEKVATEDSKRPTEKFFSLSNETNEINEINPEIFCESGYEINEINPPQRVNGKIKFVNSSISLDSSEENWTDDAPVKNPAPHLLTDDVEVF